MISILFQVTEDVNLKKATIKTTTLRSIETEPTLFEKKISDIVDDFVLYLGKNLSNSNKEGEK